jgi:hypothetical protein
MITLRRKLRNIYEILVRKSLCKGPFGRRRRRWGHVKEYEVNCLLAALYEQAVKVLVPKEVRNFLTS